jgi:methenyltetrahydrofolate cyclohydrolase
VSIPVPSVVITQTSVDDFLVRLASADPTPGGGSGAAIMGAMGAALIAMVCRVTLAKKGLDSAVADSLRALCDEADRLRTVLTSLVAEDVAVFDALMLAYRLPKATDQDKAERSDAIQARLHEATEAPLRCARACAEVIHLAQRSTAVGSPVVISDAGVAALAAYAALRSAALNVYINVPSLRDRAFATAALKEIEQLTDSSGRTNEAVVAEVRRQVAG